MTTTFAVLLAIAIAIAASLILVLINNQRRQNKTEKLLSSFNEAAAEFNLSVAKQEIFENCVIGFDEMNSKLLFLQMNGNKHNGYLIDLNEIQSCTVKRVYGSMPIDNVRTRSAEAYVDTIASQLNHKNGTKPIFLPFYDRAINPVFKMRERAEQAK